MNRTDFLKRTEWTMAILLSLMTIFLLVVRTMHAGALWRDEVAVVNLARMPSVTEIAQNFQHEAFPVPFPLFIRAYTDLFGTSDFVLRAFGIGMGVAVLCSLWTSAYLIGRGPPLVSVALLGLNATFLVWGTTIRGYGLGSALIILTFGLVVRALQSPSPSWIVLSALAALGATQCLVHNLALVFAITASAVVIGLARRSGKTTIAFLGIFTVCLISFRPYLDAYSTGSEWSEVVKFPVTFRLLWNQLNFAMGNPTPELASLWYFVFASLISIAIARLFSTRSNKPAREWDILLMTCLVAVVSLTAYYEFLHLLSYLARSWYYLALLAILAVTLDCLAASLSSSTWLRIARLIFVTVAILILPINAWPKIVERQTNIDIIAKKVEESARTDDLIVLAPWQYGISFQRYYHGPTPWITLPVVADLRVHRYDLFREKMLAAHPIDDVLEKIRETLAAGHQVWLVGGIRLPPEGSAVWSFPPATDSALGRDNVAFSEAWMQQMSVLVREHAERGETIHLTWVGPVNQYEDVPLVVLNGWQ